MIDNVPASFGSLIDDTEFEVSQNYFAKYLWIPMGLKYIELELNASFIFEYQFKILGKKNGKKLIQQNLKFLLNSVLIMNVCNVLINFEN